MKKKKSVRDRILQSGKDLFYGKGYYRSGMRDIANLAGVAVTSIYDHFKSKEAVAIAYLLEKERSQAKFLIKIMRKYPNPTEFLSKWIDNLETNIKNQTFNGCPFAGFAYQSPQLETAHQITLEKIQNRTHRILFIYLSWAKKNGYIKVNTNIMVLSRRILIFYQGGVTLLRISHEKKYIDEMRKTISDEIDKHMQFG